MGKKNRKVFLDITIGSRAGKFLSNTLAGRIVIELYYDITPITA